MNKRYIKDGKSFYTPIKIEKEIEVTVKEKNEAGEEIEVKKLKKVVQYTNVEKEILEAGYKLFQAPKMSIETLVTRSNDSINRETDAKILNKFVWNGEEFYLTMENQTNFANMFIAREFLTFPQTVKTKTGYCILENKEEVEEFYLAGVAFIKKCLEEGWQRKTEAEQEIRNNYK